MRKTGKHRSRIDGRTVLIVITPSDKDVRRITKEIYKLLADGAWVRPRAADGHSGRRTVAAAPGVSTDNIRRFLHECAVEAPGERTQSSVLHALLCAWSRCNGVPTLSSKAVAPALRELGYRKKQSNVMWWLNVRLTKRVEDFIDADGRTRKEAKESDVDNSDNGGGDHGIHP